MALGAATKGKTANPKNASAISPPTEIPDKLMFRIGEVSKIVGVETYVLRYWETEFPQLSPKKSGSGHRMYRRKEVEQLLLIRELLYERQYTIKGARNYLRELAQRRRAGEDGATDGDLFPSELVAGDGVDSETIMMAAETSLLAQQAVAASEGVPIGSEGDGVAQASESRQNNVIDISELRRELRSILRLLD